MKPSRKFQPHRGGAPGPVTAAMKGGRPFALRNPQDTTRATVRRARRRKGRGALSRALR